MPLAHLPLGAALEEYIAQARDVLAGWREGDPAFVQFVRERHPRFLRTDYPWMPRPVSDEAARREPFDEEDARLAVARNYDFADWQRLEAHVRAVLDDGSPVRRFEAAVEAVISGDLASLETMLQRHPELVSARSARVTHFDPPVHRATLLHYLAANGVEDHRQKSPPNAVAIADLLLEAGAHPDALAEMYGGRHATMSMLVSSTPPDLAGVQVGLVDALVRHGASVEAIGEGAWTSPLLTALAFGFLPAAEALVRHGARTDSLPAAAGLGRTELARDLLPAASADERHRALALAAQLGHTAIVSMLLDAGESPDRYNPGTLHAHTTPMHQAAWHGHESVVRLLVERGARLDLKDLIYEATPLGWATHGGRTAIADFLRSQLDSG